MSEYKGGLIWRKDLIADIENCTCKPCEDEKQDYNHVRCRACWVDDAVSAIDDAPAVDAVEVVRCKDCKYHSIEETECGAKYISCNRFDEVMEADDFCSYGERKDGAGNGENDPG